MRKDWKKKLAGLIGPGGVLTSPFSLSSYSYDAGLDVMKPEAVVFPRSTEDVVAVVKLAASEGIPITPRGAGTGLSGGAVPSQGGIVLSFSRMNRVLQVDWANRFAVVQAGLVNIELQNLLRQKGYFYAPDPSSEQACTLGGNVGENAGGPHCFKYGYTVNHVLGLKLVTAQAEVVDVGGPCPDPPGYDLTSLLVGSEGMLGLVTEVTVRFIPKPESARTMLAAFTTIRAAAAAVADIIGAGVIPASLEMMDKVMIQAVEASTQVGLPSHAEAVLIIEIDGLGAGLDQQQALVEEACRKHGVKKLEIARDEKAAERLWAARKGAGAAVGRIAPNQITQDGSVPLPKLPELLEEIAKLAKRHNLLIGNVMHAGDGNLHPIMIFDGRDQEQVGRVRAASWDILRACVAAGGTISGEHGIGLEKKEYMSLLFGPAEIEAMKAVKQALDPANILNPGKVFPAPVGGA
ncbi:MAG: FAD-linked oxidase C-terminal domain-containing protein [Thermodesulfobacteriota bacterium]